jgi:hypothetical protein
VQRPLSPDVRALLDRERQPFSLPATVRARALTRARAAVLAGVGRSPASAGDPRLRWAAAVGLACLVSGAVGATASQIRARWAPSPAHLAGAQVAEAPGARTTPPAPAMASPPPVAVSPPRHAHARPSPDDSAREELAILGRARASVAREDFGPALRLLAEHARRFRSGRFTEEREALRIKALAGSGRMEEAVREAVDFGVRFPHSVLLPAVVQWPASAPPPASSP